MVRRIRRKRNSIYTLLSNMCTAASKAPSFVASLLTYVIIALIFIVFIIVYIFKYIYNKIKGNNNSSDDENRIFEEKQKNMLNKNLL